ncbi:phage virion morphogenesis protein [Roseibium litorale]|uniref:Phage virion morphogenesis protein n=1 Tax=Roseibium litorale TaxID=2803841 RepID=A0ABR9CJ87_9HYPH|nr:phage virion morphogenesis protein [Roseibium litorale]MBD8890902.1 phage virion morphogenesis protein [Roseibium litorale]
MDLDLDLPAAQLGRLADLDRSELIDGLGALGASQTQRRIEEEKTDPDGTPWPANGAGSGILFQSGDLATSIDHQQEGADQVSWGSPLIYAAIHQQGGEIRPKTAKVLVFTIGGETVFAKKVTIPRRSYLGMSADNAREMEQAALRFIGEQLR